MGGLRPARPARGLQGGKRDEDDHGELAGQARAGVREADLLGALSASGCNSIVSRPSLAGLMTRAPRRSGWTTAPGPRVPGNCSARSCSSWNGTQLRPVDGANWTRNLRIGAGQRLGTEVVAAAPGIEGAISKAVHLRKDLTRIVNFEVSSRSVPSGGSLTVSGKLEQDACDGARSVTRLVLDRPAPEGQEEGPGTGRRGRT